MSQDHYTDVSQESWLSRLSGAIQGIVVGLIIFVISFPLLFWNEGRAVKTYKTLREGGQAAVSIASDRIDAGNDGKLVHLTGKAESDAKLADTVFGVSAQALKLQRTVEMYQWKETKSSQSRKKVGGGAENVTTYDYAKSWSAKRIDSSAFKEAAGHQNPATLPYESSDWVAQPIKVGAFQLSPALAGKINNYSPLELTDTAPIPASLQGRAKVVKGGFYIGTDSGAPQIGDLRVSFKTVAPSEVSLIARQTGNTFGPYQAKAGGTIELLQTGICSKDAMIQSAQASNQNLTWLLRGAGCLLMFFGLSLIFKPLSVIADLIPFVGNLVSAGTGAIAFLMAAALSLLTIAIAWVAYRPLLGVGLIAAALGVAVLIGRKIKARKQAAPVLQDAARVS